MPHSSLNFQIPYTLLFLSSPNYLDLKPFGCSCYPWLKPYAANKLQPKSSHCVFLGYCDYFKGYKCYDPVTRLTTKVFISRHVKFVETEFPYTSLTLVSSSPSEIQKFHVPITSFDDLVVSVCHSIVSPVSPVISSINNPANATSPLPPFDTPIPSSSLVSSPTPNPITSSSSPVYSPSPITSSSMPSLSTTSVSSSLNTHSMTTRAKEWNLQT